MEKGLKTLSATARTARRKSTASQCGMHSGMQSATQSVFDDHQGIPDHHSDSGIGLGSDAEMDIDDEPGTEPTAQASSWHEHTGSHRLQHHQDHHNRSRSLPQPLPLYRPPPPVIASSRRFDTPMTTSPATMSFGRPHAYQRYSPEAQNGRGGISIQAVLSPV